MPNPYNKPHLSYADQLKLLKERGLAVSDDAKAIEHLERIGYYRLRPYWLALTDLTGVFHQGAEFRHAVDLYVLDKKFRLLMLDAIERVEVSVRVDLAHNIGKRDPWGHQSPAFLDAARCARKKPNSAKAEHDAWLTLASDAIHRAKEPWLTEFRSEYDNEVPVWMAVEIWDFGTVSKLLELCHPNDRARIAKKYMLLPDTLISWIKTLVYVRNACAHHARLWNKPLIIQPKVPKTWEAKNVQHLGTDVHHRTRAYAAAAIARHFLTFIHPNSSWHERLKETWAQFPAVPNLGPDNAGFFLGWEGLPLWK